MGVGAGRKCDSAAPKGYDSLTLESLSSLSALKVSEVLNGCDTGDNEWKWSTDQVWCCPQDEVSSPLVRAANNRAANNRAANNRAAKAVLTPTRLSAPCSLRLLPLFTPTCGLCSRRFSHFHTVFPLVLYGCRLKIANKQLEIPGSQAGLDAVRGTRHSHSPLVSVLTPH